MDKHGVAEDAEAGLKNMSLKGVIAVQGFLQRQVPGRIAEKNICCKVEDLRDIGILS